MEWVWLIAPLRPVVALVTAQVTHCRLIAATFPRIVARAQAIIGTLTGRETLAPPQWTRWSFPPGAVTRPGGRDEPPGAMIRGMQGNGTEVK